MSDFMNKHVLVTGGSSGIGLGIALGFARAGAKVTITARTPSRIDSAIGRAAEQGINATRSDLQRQSCRRGKSLCGRSRTAVGWSGYCLLQRGDFSFCAAGRHERTAVG